MPIAATEASSSPLTSIPMSTPKPTHSHMNTIYSTDVAKKSMSDNELINILASSSHNIKQQKMSTGNRKKWKIVGNCWLKLSLKVSIEMRLTKSSIYRCDKWQS